MKFKNLVVNLVSIMYLYPVVVLIHELGHALAIKLLGGKVTALHVGVGKTIFKWGVFELKANPIGGLCQEQFDITPNKAGQIFMYASGVMATSITGLIISSIVGFNPVEFAWKIVTIQQPMDILKTFFFLFFFDCLNLMPMKKEKKKSDGLQIIELIFNKKKEDLLV